MFRAVLAFIVLGFFAVLLGAYGFGGLSPAIGRSLMFILLVIGPLGIIADYVVSRIYPK